MISAHDMIAAKEYTPARAAPVVADISTPGSSMKNIEISKGNEPLVILCSVLLITFYIFS